MVAKQYWKLFWGIVFSVIFIDQVTKYFVALHKPTIDWGLLRIEYITNTGAGFGILQGQVFWLAVVSFIVAVGIIAFYKKIPQEKWTQVFMGLFLGGVIGNLIDRVLRGYVIDFVNLTFWPAFNAADVALSVAVVGLLIVTWKN